MIRFTLLCMTDLQRITDNLDRLMKTTGLNSQVKLAKAAGISQTNLSNIMRHAVQPQLDTLTMLSKAVGVETWELLAPTQMAVFIRRFQAASPETQRLILLVAAGLIDQNRDAT